MILKEIIKKNAMALVAIAVATTSLTMMSFVENDTIKQTTFTYHLDASGNIGLLANPNPPECSLEAGTYCSVELSSPRPAGMDNISDAEASDIWVQTNYKTP